MILGIIDEAGFIYGIISLRAAYDPFDFQRVWNHSFMKNREKSYQSNKKVWNKGCN